MSEVVVGAVGAVVAAIFGVLGVTQGHLWSRLKHTEEQVKEMWDNREADALKKRRLGDHIDRLEHHIWNEHPPPPPERPDDI